MQPKVCQSENQRPNSMLTNLTRNSSIRDTEAERKEKEGGEGSNTTSRRDPKSAYNPASSIQKNLKLVHKVILILSACLVLV
ncbi:hypothetical protein M0R45_027065 [Rubus argutus]|uniref:Uncharacterized protein n=1 Tax=Rubus argutus TaxID=59490 RepID=A0AAW1WZ76_RUBAR